MNVRRPDRSDRPESERLLDTAAAGTPLAAAPLARLLAAAAAPARPGELAGEQEAVAAFRAARATRADAPVVPTRRRRGLTAGMVAWVAGLAATATAGVAFAAVTLDHPAEPERPPSPAPTSVEPTPQRSPRATHLTPSGKPGPGPSSAAVPATPGGPRKPAGAGRLAGHCRAYLAKSPGQRAKALTRPGFADLVAAVGGADRVEAFCRGLLAARDADHATNADRQN
ncbi:hypothetical protein [Micromonospora sp. NPDC092111]|uniref:hypothetical protein n=1 Tax=Micromonospora sp. NPDC092111 TaxID=3364289 RepID=UPI00381D314D